MSLWILETSHSLPELPVILKHDYKAHSQSEGTGLFHLTQVHQKTKQAYLQVCHEKSGGGRQPNVHAGPTGQAFARPKVVGSVGPSRLTLSLED